MKKHILFLSAMTTSIIQANATTSSTTTTDFSFIPLPPLGVTAGATTDSSGNNTTSAIGTITTSAIGTTTTLTAGTTTTSATDDAAAKAASDAAAKAAADAAAKAAADAAAKAAADAAAKAAVDAAAKAAADAATATIADMNTTIAAIRTLYDELKVKGPAVAILRDLVDKDTTQAAAKINADAATATLTAVKTSLDTINANCDKINGLKNNLPADQQNNPTVAQIVIDSAAIQSNARGLYDIAVPKEAEARQLASAKPA